MSTSAAAFVYRPSTIEGIRAVFDIARSSGRSVAFRGAGRSYGDASLNTEQIILDMTRYNRILEWDPKSGVITVESGVTIQQLWQYILPDGWWPPVVPGTMFPTLGGCAAMNIHGKNNFRVGPIGDHILTFDLMLPSGEIKTCSREENSELFYAAIGGFGVLGCFTTMSLQMKRVYSGLLEVEPVSVPNLDAMIAFFEERMDTADYLVGWIDGFAAGEKLGRGEIHQADYLPEGADKNPTQTLRLENQQLPDTILGIVPKSILWKFMRPFTNNFGTRFVNLAKYLSSVILARGGKTYRQSHATFAFLLDYVPNWKKSYGEGGLIQYQSFIPEKTAAEAFKKQLQLTQEEGYPSYLAVFKRHRKDDFLMRHSVDGYSLALDFKVTKKNRKAIWEMAHKLDKIVLEAGGRFYFAKDSTLEPGSAERYLGKEAIEAFRKLKKECDPEGMLETNLSRRLFGSL